MGKHRNGALSAKTDDGSVEVFLMEDGWSPIVVFQGGGGQTSFVRRVENNVAWMLQTLLDTGSKVDTLYEMGRHDYRTMKDIKRKLGNSAGSDITVVQISGRPQRWQNVKAAGVGGKRSHIFALILALGMTGGFSKMFKQELEKYGLAKQLIGLLAKIEDVQKMYGTYTHWQPQQEKSEDSRSSRPSNFEYSDRRAGRREREQSRPGSARCSPSRKRPKRTPSTASSRGSLEERRSEHNSQSCEDVGVKLRMVCKTVPVVRLEANSPFSITKNISWLLQTALAQDSRAHELMEYITDTSEHHLLTNVEKECEELDLRSDEIRIAKVADVPFTEVLGVGTSGVNSAMLAVVIALALRDEGQLEDIRENFADGHEALEQPFYGLVERAVALKDSLDDSDALPEVTWDPYMAAEEGVWNKPTARNKPFSRLAYTDSTKQRILHGLGLTPGRDARRRGEAQCREMSRSRSPERWQG